MWWVLSRVVAEAMWWVAGLLENKANLNSSFSLVEVEV